VVAAGVAVLLLACWARCQPCPGCTSQVGPGGQGGGHSAAVMLRKQCQHFSSSSTRVTLMQALQVQGCRF
jgi:hypothetical protein